MKKISVLAMPLLLLVACNSGPTETHINRFYAVNAFNVSSTQQVITRDDNGMYWANYTNDIDKTVNLDFGVKTLMDATWYGFTTTFNTGIGWEGLATDIGDMTITYNNRCGGTAKTVTYPANISEHLDGNHFRTHFKENTEEFYQNIMPIKTANKYFNMIRDVKVLDCEYTTTKGWIQSKFDFNVSIKLTGKTYDYVKANINSLTFSFVRGFEGTFSK